MIISATRSMKMKRHSGGGCSEEKRLSREAQIHVIVIDEIKLLPGKLRWISTGEREAGVSNPGRTSTRSGSLNN